MNDRNQILVVAAIIFVCIIGGLNFLLFEKPKNIEVKKSAQLVYVPISFGKIVSIARRPTSVTIAFESGDIVVVSINTGVQKHIKVIWR